MNLLLLFTTFTILNVVLSTVKTIVTTKGGALAAALVNAVTYGLYTYVIIYTTADGLPMIAKAGITATANFIGVYIVKAIETKARRDRLWKIECTLPKDKQRDFKYYLSMHDIPCNHFEVGPWVIFNTFCSSKAESDVVISGAVSMKGKYFASESTL